MNKVSVILPTYNEKDNIISLITRIRDHLKNIQHEIIVVDDDSPDKTWQEVEKIADGNIKLIRRMNQRCLTTAISDGINSSTGDVVVWMDCDLSMPPEKIKDLLDKIKEGYDISVGSRYVPGGGMVIVEKSKDSMLAAVLSFFMNYIIQKVLDPSFKDYTSGFVAVRKKVFDNIKLHGDYGEYFIDFIYRALKYRYKIVEVPYISMAREYGVSKTGTNLLQYFKRGRKYLWTTLRLKFIRYDEKRLAK